MKIEKDEYGILDYLRDDFVDTTMKESMPLIAKWFGRVGKGLEYVPGLKGVGKAYEAIGEIADFLNLAYELIHEIHQADAFEKGGKAVVKKVKPVKKIAESLIKKKYPNLPEPLRKKAAEALEDWFEKNAVDPGLKKLKDEAEKQDTNKDLQKTLYEVFKEAVSPSQTLQ